MLSKYTDFMLDRINEKQLPLFPDFVDKVQLVNFVDRANKVQHDLEHLIRVN